MSTIAIAFAFDNNLVFPACVSISSLLMSANKETFYDIFILHSEHEKLNREELDKIPKFFNNCNLQYRAVSDVFDNAFEIRGITTPAYYRLLIPEVIPEYSKVIYADADIIFRMDLSSIYAIDLGDKYLAATRDLGLNFSAGGIKYIRSVPELHEGDYIQSGFIILNCELIRNNGVVEEFKRLAKRKLKFQDQDILNISCYGNIEYLPLEYNMTDYSFYYSIKEKEKIAHLFTEQQISNAIACGNLHYNGHKPWKKYCVNFDIWWEFYRKSPFFDEKTYFDFYFEKLDELDKLPFIKRIKILLRYFIVKRK